jgi:hypothetical protein
MNLRNDLVMPDTTHVMVDLETLSTDTHPIPIVQIGAIKFMFSDPNPTILDVFSRNVRLTEQIEMGARVSDATVRWWFKQNPEAQKNVFGGDSVGIYTAMTDFMYCMGASPNRHIYLWSHATFDTAILNDWVQRLNLINRFIHRNHVDMRTIRFLYDRDGSIAKSTPPEGVSHTAVSDCLWQVRWLNTCVTLNVR